MIETFANADALADAAAAWILDGLADGLMARGHATLVGTGGRSPGPVYDRLSQAELDWGRVTVTLSDDRFVSPNHPDSNAGLVRRRLLVGAAAAASFQPLRYDVADEDASAEAAEPHIRPLVPFDVLMLGMGEDGHIASLIPGDPRLAQGLDPAGSRLVQGVPAGLGAPPLPHMTLTLPALASARRILILTSGEARRRVLEGGDVRPVHVLAETTTSPLRVLWTP